MTGPEPQPNKRRARLALVVLGGVGMLVAYRLGAFDAFADPARLRDSLVALGPKGYLAFVVAYALFQPFGVPGTVFVFAAPLIWPWPVAFALSMTGTMAASVVGYSFARFVARDWVASRIPEKFRRYDEAIEERAFLTVFVLRFVFWMPQALHAFFGVSRVGFWTHFWASLLGYLLPLWAVSYFGERVFEALVRAPIEIWVAVGIAALVAVAGSFWWRRRRRARREV